MAQTALLTLSGGDDVLSTLAGGLLAQDGQSPPMQYSNAGGMLVVLGAMVVVVLLCRWVFSTGHRDQRTAKRLAEVRDRGDFGLLVPVVTVRTADEAAGLRDRLRGGGIRGTVAEGATPEEHVVLVFRTDVERARGLVSG